MSRTICCQCGIIRVIANANPATIRITRATTTYSISCPFAEQPDTEERDTLCTDCVLLCINCAGAVEKLRSCDVRSNKNCERADVHLPDASGGRAGFPGFMSEMRDVARAKRNRAGER